MAADMKLAEIAAMLADPSRARLLLAMMDGRSHTAKELAYLAGISPATASAHLGKLLGLGLIAVTPSGRHRYYRIGSEAVCRMIEAVGAVAAEATAPPVRLLRADRELRLARTCYDHIAGQVGVLIAEHLQETGGVILSDEGGEITPAGEAIFADLDIDLSELKQARRIFCRPCLDWTERRNHLAGAVGAALCTRLFELGWITRMRDTRALTIPAAGRAGLARLFRIDVDELPGG